LKFLGKRLRDEAAEKNSNLLKVRMRKALKPYLPLYSQDSGLVGFVNAQ